MTALNASIGRTTDGQSFRRGLLAGVVASAVLGATMTAAAFASGWVQPADSVAPAAPAAPAPAQVAPMPNSQPAPPIDAHNPFTKGPVRAY